MAPRDPASKDRPADMLGGATEGGKPTAFSEKVTYTPGPEGPMETEWNGHKFLAHVPKSIEIPDPALPADAAVSKRMRENRELVERARDNKYFHVGEFDAAKHSYRERVDEPKTAEAYRAWAVHWMNGIRRTPNGTWLQAAQRWSRETNMRLALEVGFDDYKYISDFFSPILHELIRKEPDPRAARDEIIARNDFADLFLQIDRVGLAAA